MNEVMRMLGKAFAAIITHYYYDHHTLPSDRDVSDSRFYLSKFWILKNPNIYINEGQWHRARKFIDELLKLAGEVAELRSRSAELDAALGRVGETLQDLASRVVDYDVEIGEVRSEVEAAASAVRDLEARVRAVEGLLEDYSRNVTGIISAVEELYALYNDLLERYRCLEEAIRSLNATEGGQAEAVPGSLERAVAETSQWYFWYIDPLQYRELLTGILRDVVHSSAVYSIIGSADIDANDPTELKI